VRAKVIPVIPVIQAKAGTKAKTNHKKLATCLGDYAWDPHGWVLFAFGWGKGELAGFDGPDLWQCEQLEEIGEKLRALGALGAPAECAAARGGGRYEDATGVIIREALGAPAECAAARGGGRCDDATGVIIREALGAPAECAAARGGGRCDDATGVIIREAIASGHGIGKSALVAWLILWAMSTFKDTKGVVTANTETQLKTKNWAELAKWFRLCWFAPQMFEMTATAIFSVSPQHQKTWRIDMVPWSERNTEAFAGLHNKGKRILLIFDEASAIPDVVWEVSEGALTDEGTQIIWCVFGNPTRNTGRFKDCFTGKRRHRWNTRQIDSRTSIFVNRGQIDEWISDYGIDSDFVKVRVRGMFPAMSARQFISVADVDAAYGRHLRPEQYGFAPKILTCDPAWEGDDELVIGLRQGLAFKILRTIPKNDNDIQVAGIIANLEDSEGADAVFVDAGYGTGIVSAGRTLGRTWQLVWFAGESADPGCLNKRAEMWKLMRDWLKEGGAIPLDNTLYNDLIGPETVGRVDGKIQIEAKAEMKRRGLPSPTGLTLLRSHLPGRYR
jgi:hypothetical protein